MKSEAEIRARLRGLLVQELDRRVQDATRRLPRRCRFHHQQALDVRRLVDGEPNESFNQTRRSLPVLGLCGHGVEDPTEWSGTICEDPIDAQRCPLFEAKQSKDDLRQEFERQLQTPEWVQENLPEVAGLCWALGVVQTPALPWWRRFWFRILRIRVEPVLSAGAAAAQMLGEGEGQELLRDLYQETPHVDDP